MRDGQKVTIYVGGVTHSPESEEPSRSVTGTSGSISRTTGMATVKRRHRLQHLEGRARHRPVRRDRRKGRGGHAGLGSPWYARYEGFLTAS